MWSGEAAPPGRAEASSYAKAKKVREPQAKVYAVPSRIVARRGIPAGFIRCPAHEDYVNPDQRAWSDEPIVHSPEDTLVLHQLFHREGNRLTHPAFDPHSTPLQRAVNAYHILPQSYKDRIWRVAADDLTANYRDSTITPDSAFLPKEMKDQIWAAEVCVSMCPNDTVCPWIEDCEAFTQRKTRWDQQRVNSRVCYDRWDKTKIDRAKWAADAERRRKRLEKKEAIRARMREERKLSLTMFHPKEFTNKTEMVGEIQAYVDAHKRQPEPRVVRPMVSAFPSTTPLDTDDFLCLIADYFHDGMPGFRITNLRDPKISGIRVHHPDIIRLGKEKHQMFMYQFLKHVLENMRTQAVPIRLRTLSATLLRENHLALPPLSQERKVTPEHALTLWRKSIGLEGARVEDSMNPHLPIPDINGGTHLRLKTIASKHPWLSYQKYLDTGERALTIHIEEGETKTIGTEAANRVITFLLLVLFGPSYEGRIANFPALFTFDAHKGHMNRIIAASDMAHVSRLVTPYNVADSAMTENFVKDPEPGLSAAEAAELAALEAEVDAEEAGVHVAEEDVHEEEENDDLAPLDVQVGAGAHVAAQRRPSRFAFSLAEIMALGERDASASAAAASADAVASPTNMIFDDNWLIYYKNMGFSQQTPYHFSMNIVDAGLYRYVHSHPSLAIPSSFYMVEAPFSGTATRGPSLNYLMMGLLRGSMSDVFSRRSPFGSEEELYHHLVGLQDAFTDPDTRMVEKLLPIYSIPVSSHSLPLFQHMAMAPLLAYHMLYDLQHHRSALPSRIKWAGDREQYMAVQGVPHGVFVTLDTTGYFCAIKNNVASLLERKGSMKLVGKEANQTMKDSVRDFIEAYLMSNEESEEEEEENAAMNTSALPKASVIKQPPLIPPRTTTATKKATQKKMLGTKKGGSLTRKNARLPPDAVKEMTSRTLDRDYFLLEWLYPLVMAVNAAWNDQHPAEHAYVLLRDLRDTLSYSLLFPVLYRQFLHAVSRIPSKEIMETAITAETYDKEAPRCLSLLTARYTGPSSLFADPDHTKTLLGYLQEMKPQLLRRYPYQDATSKMLHALLEDPDPQTACLTLAMLFERLHGRIQNGTSYLGQIVGVTGGAPLENVDNEAAWEHLTVVLREDRAAMETYVSKVAAATTTPTKVAVIATATPTKVATPTKAATAITPTMPVTPATPIKPATPKGDMTPTRRTSMKKHRPVNQRNVRELKKALGQLRRTNAYASPVTPFADRMTPFADRMASVVAGGAKKKTQRRKKRSSSSTRRH